MPGSSQHFPDELLEENAFRKVHTHTQHCQLPLPALYLASLGPQKVLVSPGFPAFLEDLVPLERAMPHGEFSL